jgi:putative alpha-1,2-mannosidase
VFSALGFYPVTPGTTQYVFGSPLFDKVTMTMQNGNKFVIEAKGNGEQNDYIQSANLNDENYQKTWIDHKDIQDGGKLIFDMGSEPNKNRGIGTSSRPYSLSTEKK